MLIKSPNFTFLPTLSLASLSQRTILLKVSTCFFHNIIQLKICHPKKSKGSGMFRYWLSKVLCWGLTQPVKRQLVSNDFPFPWASSLEGIYWIYPPPRIRWSPPELSETLRQDRESQPKNLHLPRLHPGWGVDPIYIPSLKLTVRT